MAKLMPLGDKVVIKPLKQEEVTKSGIVLPDSAKEKSQEGTVLAIGKGKLIDGTLSPLEVKVGDKVLFDTYMAAKKIDGEELYILPESDILAIVGE